MGRGMRLDGMARIETEVDVARGVAVLLALEPEFARVPLPLPLRRRADGFGALLQAIVGQQVSTASAAAIWARVEAAGLHRGEAVLAAPDKALADVGLSRPKIRYARALAEARLDYAALRGLSADQVTRQLTAVPGIGQWTADIYALSALGHADVFPAGDLALQEGARLLFDLPARLNEREMATQAAAWAPVRAIAARALWAYYRVQIKREGVL